VKPAAVVGLLALVVFPVFAGDFFVNLGTQILVAAVFAASLNLLVGYGGLTSLGHAAFLGIAAYVCAWTGLHLNAPPMLAGLLACLGTVLAAALFGAIALRASGLGFLMITLAMAQVVWGLAYRLVSVSNGDNGLAGIQRPHPFGLALGDPAAFYWFALAVAAIAVACMALFVRSAFGATLQGTRDQPRRMAALGHDVWMIRWITFIFAGFWAGVAGLLFVWYNKFIHPSALSMTASAEALLAVIAGGAGTLSGPLVGAALLVLLKNYASAYIERWNMLLGFVFLVIVLFLPEGIVPGLCRLLTRRAVATPAASPIKALRPPEGKGREGKA
jgi:branched-chain amino acid transport system permease protein